jgi:hypothetical protein
MKDEGGWAVADGGWQVAGGGWQVAGGGWRIALTDIYLPFAAEGQNLADLPVL